MSDSIPDYLSNPFSSPEGGFFDTHERLTPEEISQENALVITGLLHEVDKAREEGFAEASIDSVTKLPNRAYFERQLEETIESGMPFSIAILDVTALKRINDSMGHVSGDNLLYAAAQSILSAIRKDDFVARIGGDEFGVIVSDVPHRDETLSAIQRNEAFTTAVLEGLADYADNENLTQYGVSIAIGISPYKFGEQITETMMRADKNMYAHKNEQYIANGDSPR